MTTGTSSQSQPSYLHSTIEQKPNFQAFPPHQLMDQSSAQSCMNRLAHAMYSEEGQRFYQCLRSLDILFTKGYSHLFLTHTLLMRKMMNYFTQLGKQIEDDQDNTKTQLCMLHILSLIAELLRLNPKFYYPFTRKFLVTMFSVDQQLIENSPMRKQIMAILGVIYENLSRQPKLVTKHSIEQVLKYAVLSKYRLIQQVSTLKSMNKTITNLATKGIHCSVADFHKFKVLDTVSSIIANNQMDLFMLKMKMTMFDMSNPKKSKDHATVEGFKASLKVEEQTSNLRNK